MVGTTADAGRARTTADVRLGRADEDRRALVPRGLLWRTSTAASEARPSSHMVTTTRCPRRSRRPGDGRRGPDAIAAIGIDL